MDQDVLHFHLPYAKPHKKENTSAGRMKTKTKAFYLLNVLMFKYFEQKSRALANETYRCNIGCLFKSRYPVIPMLYVLPNAYRTRDLLTKQGDTFRKVLQGLPGDV